MSDNAKGSSGADQDNSSGVSGSQEQSVSYETHRKLLGEKKRRDEELAEVKRQLDSMLKEKQEAEEKRLLETNEFKTLYESQKEKTMKLETELKTREERETNARKLNAFLKHLGGSVEDKYWVHIDIDKIAVNPETKEVDEMTVTKEIERFKATYPELIKKQGGGARLPSDAPQGSAVNKISYDEWKKLPLKEMKKYKVDQIETV